MTAAEMSSRALVAAAALLFAGVAVFAMLAEDVVTSDPIVRVDQVVADRLHERHTPVLTTVMIAITTLGSAWVLVPLAVASVAQLLRRGARRGAALVTLAIVGSEALVLSLKAGFQRERPFFADPLAIESSFSFPSGHATVSVAVYGAVGLLVARRVRGRAARAGALALTALVVLLIGFSRLYLGVHFLSDVLAGFSVGGAWLVLCVLALELRPRLGSRAPPDAGAAT